jgi:polyhydroxyalkanoate synthesis regulator phasin
MNRKERRRKQARERRTDKAWEQADKDADDIIEAWLKKGEMSPEEATQLCENLEKDIHDVFDYHKASVGIARIVLLTMVAQSLAQQALAQQATDSDRLAEDATLLGKSLVTLALELFDQNSSAH